MRSIFKNRAAYESLHNDPRLAELIRKIGLEPWTFKSQARSNPLASMRAGVVSAVVGVRPIDSAIAFSFDISAKPTERSLFIPFRDLGLIFLTSGEVSGGRI